jgi:hypothetical protein
MDRGNQLATVLLGLTPGDRDTLASALSTANDARAQVVAPALALGAPTRITLACRRGATPTQPLVVISQR